MVKSTQKKELVPCKELKLSASQVHYKKLMAYLLLLYRSYLKDEITLEPTLKMALWRMVKLHKEFSLKIQLTQSEFVNSDEISLDGNWDEVKDLLFPKDEVSPIKQGDLKHQATMKEYKEAALDLLQRD